MFYSGKIPLRMALKMALKTVKNARIGGRQLDVTKEMKYNKTIE